MCDFPPFKMNRFFLIKKKLPFALTAFINDLIVLKYQ